jgi:hypothetical protein
VDLDSPAAVRAFTGTAGGRLRLLPDRLYRLTVPGLCLVGGPADGSPSWIERLAGDLGGRPDAIRFNRKGKLTLTLAGGERPLLVKVPLTPLAEENCRRNHQALELVHGCGLAALGRLTPRPVKHGTLDRQPWFAETICEGRPWAETDRRHDPAVKQQIDGTLQLLRQVPVETETGSAVGLLASLHELDERQRGVLQRVDRRFRREAATPCLRKGDFSLSNVMVSDGSVSGLIDFDEWGVSPTPLADAADLELSRLRHREGVFWVEGLTRLWNDDESGLGIGAVAAWLGHAGHGCRLLHHRLNRRWFERVVIDVIDALDRMID